MQNYYIFLKTKNFINKFQKNFCNLYKSRQKQAETGQLMDQTVNRLQAIAEDDLDILLLEGHKSGQYASTA
jgi:hypothetical protein